MRANIDYLGKNATSGEVAEIIRNNELNAGAMRPFLGVKGKSKGKSLMTIHMGGAKVKKNYKTVIAANATLRRDEWNELDSAIQPIARTRLRGIQDLNSMGLIYNLGNAMGTTTLEYHDISDAFEAELTMDGISRAKNDRVNYGTHYLPIPIIHVDYEINLRELNASRRLGNPLDTTYAENATRKVAEKLEGMLFTDTTKSFGNGTIYSYVNYPDRNEVTITTSWANSSVTGANIVKEVSEAKQALIDMNMFGPYKMYISKNYETKMDQDYSAAKGSNTIRERILKIENINGVSVSDTLADDTVILVQMTKDVVRLVKGLGIQNVQWQAEGKFINKFKVLTIQVPQIRSDQDGNCGIVHMSL